jgi:hypothetical protein
MSRDPWWWQRWARAAAVQYELSPAEAHVLLALTSWADKSGQLHVHLDTLAAVVRRSPDNVGRALTQLGGRGLIVRQRRGPGRAWSTRLVDADPMLTTAADPSSASGADPSVATDPYRTASRNGQCEQGEESPSPPLVRDRASRGTGRGLSVGSEVFPSPLEPTSPHEQQPTSSDNGALAPDPSLASDQDTRTEGEQAARHLCLNLARRIKGNDPKAKLPAAFYWPDHDHLELQVGHPSAKPWLDAMRLLIDRDERPLPEVVRVLVWCQDDEFWKGNILSAPTFREKFPKLRAAWLRAEGAPDATATSSSTRDQLAAVYGSYGSGGAPRGSAADLRRRAGGGR